MTLCPPCSTMNSPAVCEDGNVTVSVPIIASFFSVSVCGTKNCPGPYTSSALQLGFQTVPRGNPELVRQFRQRPLQGRCP